MINGAGRLFIKGCFVGVLLAVLCVSFSTIPVFRAYAEESGGGADGGGGGGDSGGPGDGPNGGMEGSGGAACAGGGGGGGLACGPCDPEDTKRAKTVIEQFHAAGEYFISQHTSEEFNKHRDTFLYKTFFLENFLPALMKMTEQLSAVGMQQIFTVGTFFDAKNQLDTQRTLQELQAEAHKDYQPSDDFCWFGTNVRSLAHSESLSRFNALALSQRAMARHLGRSGVAATNADTDKGARWRQFVGKYCDPKDNQWVKDVPGTGLEGACGKTGGSDPEKRNIDVDFTRLIEEPHTLSVNFTDGEIKEGSQEEDIIALANNLYGHNVIKRLTGAYLDDQDNQKKYMALRAVAAKRSVAENSFNAIVGLKSSGSSGPDSQPDTQTWKYLGAILKELGMDDKEITKVMGKNPSYYAQLEILAQKIYQSPDFYANLYDKPANVERKSAALKAIDLMVDRAIFESQLRQEMLMSVMLSGKIEPRFKEANGKLRP